MNQRKKIETCYYDCPSPTLIAQPEMHIAKAFHLLNMVLSIIKDISAWIQLEEYIHIYISRDVLFNETSFPFSKSQQFTNKSPLIPNASTTSIPPILRSTFSNTLVPNIPNSPQPHANSSS